MAADSDEIPSDSLVAKASGNEDSRIVFAQSENLGFLADVSCVTFSGRFYRSLFFSHVF